MNERIALTQAVAAKLLRHGFSGPLTDPATSLGALQRFHNVLALFPRLLQQSALRASAWRSLQTAISMLKSLTASSGALWDPLLLCYTCELFRQAEKCRAAFTAKQQAMLETWIASASELATKALSRSDVDAALASNPFAHLQLSPPASLHLLSKQKCSKCGRAVKFYCTQCQIVLSAESAAKLPKVELPFALDIVLHHSVDLAKCTALHTLLLVKTEVRVHQFPSLPEYNPATDIVVFPADDALSIGELARSSTALSNALAADATAAAADEKHARSSSPAAVAGEQSPSVRRAVLLEGTWDEARAMLQHKRFAGLRRVKLHMDAKQQLAAGDKPTISVAAEQHTTLASDEKSETSCASSVRTHFWRFQKHGSGFLSSIEAIHQLAVQFAAAFSASKTSARDSRSSAAFDDVLWLFREDFERVRAYYKQNPQLLPPPMFVQEIVTAHST